MIWKIEEIPSEGLQLKYVNMSWVIASNWFTQESDSQK